MEKVFKGRNCTIVKSCLGEAPCPSGGPLQLVGFNRASEHTNSFPERNSVQIQSDSCFFD